MLIQQNTATYPLMFLLVSSDDHVTAVTGASPTVTISKNGGSFASPAGAVSEIGNGWYQLAGNATDTSALGPLAIHATADNADPVDIQHEVIAFNPQAAANLGLTNLDATISSRGTSIFDPTTENVTLSANQHVIVDSGVVTSVTNPVTVGTNNDKTGYSFDGVSLATATEASATIRDIPFNVFRDGSVTLYAHVYNDGKDIQCADVSSLVYSIYLLDESDKNARTAVDGHLNVSLTVAEVISDTVQSDAVETGYNFKHTPPVAEHPVFTIAGRHYLVEYVVTLKTNEPILVRFKVNVL